MERKCLAQALHSFAFHYCTVYSTTAGTFCVLKTEQVKEKLFDLPKRGILNTIVLLAGTHKHAHAGVSY